MKLVWGTVTEVVEDSSDIQRLAVDVDDAASGSAINYVALAGRCAVDDRIVLNTTAVDLALGTGGTHFVVAREGAGSGTVLQVPSGGHVMKLRYTPLQVDVVSVEAQESPHHAVMVDAADLGGMPVVCCSLHSHVPLVAAAIKDAAPKLHVSYCMTDQAALPLALSDVVRACRARGLLDSTVTCGQAFGGEYEAVNVHSGLLASRHVIGADVAVVAIGPGVVGTGTALGHGGVAQGEAINAAGVLGGRPVACLRVSFADARERHQCVSHHTLTALTRIALVPAVVPVPTTLAERELSGVEGALEDAGVFGNHQRMDVARVTDVSALKGIAVKSMGRGITDDPAFFAAAFAAGRAAARLANGAC